MVILNHYEVIKNDHDNTIIDLVGNNIKYVSTSENKVRNINPDTGEVLDLVYIKDHFKLI